MFIKLPSLNSPDFLLQPIRIHGFATLNTTLYYREHTSLTVALLPSGDRCFLAFGQYLLVARRAFITGEFFFGGLPGLLLQVKFHDG